MYTKYCVYYSKAQNLAKSKFGTPEHWMCKQRDKMHQQTGLTRCSRDYPYLNLENCIHSISRTEPTFFHLCLHITSTY